MTNEALVEQLIQDGYLKTQSIIDAFKNVDRAHFVTEDQKQYAYKNYPLPIGFGQTISQPLTVAFILELLSPQPGEKILDVGSGSGWQAALLAYCVGGEGKVIGIERVPELKKFAEENSTSCEAISQNVIRLVEGDGAKGFEEEAPFDKIIAAATARAIPTAWKKQLKVGGIIVAPVEESIYVLEKKSQDEFEEKRYFGFNFVPLIGGK